VDKNVYAFGSSADAEEEFERQKKSPFRALDQTAKNALDPMVTSDRAVTKVDDGEFFIVRWRDDRILRIGSRSFAHAILFENQLSSAQRDVK
jgi:hypothetical protein